MDSSDAKPTLCSAARITTNAMKNRVTPSAASSLNAPVNPRLCGFKRISVPAGETVTVGIAVPECRLNVINNEGEAVMEGKPVFYVGMGQPDSRTEKLTGHAAIRVE